MVRDRKTQSSDEGIALVIVLGILSILLILGVAFATALRTEELATRNSVDSIRARQLIDVAVPRALEAIDRDRDNVLGDGDFFMTYSQATANRILPSSGGTGDTFPISNLMSGTASRYLPRGVTNEVLTADDPEWILIDSSPAGSIPAFTGRIAYVAVDVSDYIDGNLAGGWTRDFGTNVGEIALLDVQDLSSFTNQRKSVWGEFDTHADIEMLAGSFLDGGENYLMQPFSYFPSNYWNAVEGRETEHFDIRSAIAGSNYNSIDKDDINQGMIEQAIEDSGIGLSDDPARRRRLAANIVDYLDNDNVPGNGQFPASICTEAVPMVNEVRLANQLRTQVTGGQTNWISRMRVDVELWFPFVGVNTSPNEFRVELRGLLVGPMSPTPDLNFLIQNEPLTLGISANGFDVYSLEVVEKTTQTKPNFSQARGAVEIAVLEKSTGDLVDHLYFEVDNWAEEMFEESIPPTEGHVVNGGIDKQADDPRLNWNWTDPVQWRPSEFMTDTLGETNDNLTVWGAGADGHEAMYVRNGLYRSPGELGQLLFDELRPWQTIRLLAPDPDSTARLVEHFAASTGERGYVNLNTGDTDVLASAFVDSPVRRVPDDSTSSRISIADARLIASAIFTQGVGAGFEFKSRADLGQLVLAADLGSISSIGNDAVAESVISDAYGLLGTRQNMFVVLAIAQVYAPKLKIVTAERRAAVRVWRDPLPNNGDDAAEGRHSAFVRNLVWLNE